MKTKNVLPLIAAALMLASCSQTDIVSSDEGSLFDERGGGWLAEEMNKAADHKTEAAADYSGLSTEKHGYGQGVQLDADNRPAGALDFNNVYGRYDASAIGDKDSNIIRLTFDQGYENGYTAKILDTLKEQNVKATFFVLDDYARREPELVRRMIDEGHIVGNHSVTHRSMPTLSAEECRSEIMDLHKYIKDEFGYEMTEFRPPMGEFSELSLAVTKDCGYRTLLWSYAYADWDVNDQPDPEKALGRLTEALHNGAVYLLHSVSSTNAAILGDFIKNARASGYDFEPLA